MSILIYNSALLSVRCRKWGKFFNSEKDVERRSQFVARASRAHVTYLTHTCTACFSRKLLPTFHWMTLHSKYLQGRINTQGKFCRFYREKQICLQAMPVHLTGNPCLQGLSCRSSRDLLLHLHVSYRVDTIHRFIL